MAKEREYKCAYPHCLHHGEKVKSSVAVVENGRRYHWDCFETKRDLQEIKATYKQLLDERVSLPVLSKVLNDLVFKYDTELDYIKFAISYYGKFKTKIRSPFTLLYLRDNKYMKAKYQKFKNRRR